MNGRYENCLTRNCIHRCIDKNTNYCLRTGELIKIRQGTKICSHFDSQANYTPDISCAEKDRSIYFKERHERIVYGL